MAQFSKIVFLFTVFTLQSNINTAINNKINSLEEINNLEDMRYTLKVFNMNENKQSTLISNQTFAVIRDQCAKNDSLRCLIQNEIFMSDHIIKNLENQKNENGANRDKEYKVVISYKTGESKSKDGYTTISTIVPDNKLFYIQSQFSNGDYLVNCFKAKYQRNESGIYPIIWINSSPQPGSYSSADQLYEYCTFQNFISIINNTTTKIKDETAQSVKST